MSGIYKLLGDHVHNVSGEKVDLKAKCAGKMVAIYFSASWCGPCHAFTPVLAEFYKTHQNAKNLEIIFASSDQSKKDFEKYYAEMPWLALSYEERQLVRLMSQILKLYMCKCLDI